jgi:hypothetical protein
MVERSWGDFHMSPIYEEIEGARAGETVEFNGRKLVIEDIA